jgi:hypothetical protein
MALTLGPILIDSGLDPVDAIAIRYAYVTEHADTGFSGIHADSTDAEILKYTLNQPANTQLLLEIPPRFWVVFIREGGDQARFWSALENLGEVSNDGMHGVFDLVESPSMGYKAPRQLRQKPHKQRFRVCVGGSLRCWAL